MITRLFVTAGVLAAASLASPALARQTAAPAAQPLGGPVIAGVCLLSREAVFANAAAGKAASARLTELARTAQAEVDAERAPIEAELRALEGQADSPARRQKAEALNARWQPLQQKAAVISREIELTRAKAMERIANEAQPVVAQAYMAKKCGLLLDRGSALGGNFANDLTAEVVKGLDQRMSSITFERERLAQPAAAPAGAAPVAPVKR
jgi:Skp family chaperone for outer membrane proteins